MEKKAYIAPKMNVHSLKMDAAILVGSQSLNPESVKLNAGGIRMGTQTALSKGGFGSIFDDDDYDDYEDDF